MKFVTTKILLNQNMAAAAKHGKKLCVHRYHVYNHTGSSIWRNTCLLEGTRCWHTHFPIPERMVGLQVLYGPCFHFSPCMTSCTRQFASAMVAEGNLHKSGPLRSGRPSISLIKCSKTIVFSFNVDMHQFLIALTVCCVKISCV